MSDLLVTVYTEGMPRIISPRGVEPDPASPGWPDPEPAALVEWREVPGFPYVEMAPDRSLRSWAKMGRPRRPGGRAKHPRPLKAFANRAGQPTASLRTADGRTLQRTVDSLFRLTYPELVAQGG